MIHNFESLVPVGVIHAANVDKRLELALSMISQESEDRRNCGRGYVECKLVFVNGKLLDKFG
jgi:hypothetical protein